MFFKIGSKTWNCMKKRFQNRCFPVNIEKFLRLTFYNTLVAAASGSNCSELYKFLDSYFFNLQKCLFKIFPDGHFWNHIYKKKNNHLHFVNINLVFLVFLLALLPNGLVDSFPFKYISCLRSLFWLNRIWESWYLIIWLEITAWHSIMGFWTVTL